MERIVVSLEEFAHWAQLPENANREYELVSGAVLEAPPVPTSNSELHNLLVFAVRLFCREHDRPCHTTSGDGAYAVLGNVIAPDFAYKPTPMSDIYPDPEPPLWAVEIISPTDKATDIRNKREIYRRAEILLWEIYPQSQSIDVYAPGQLMRTVGIVGTLDGGDVLPGFTLAVRELFPD